jgi:hypothetical protein
VELFEGFARSKAFIVHNLGPFGDLLQPAAILKQNLMRSQCQKELKKTFPSKHYFSFS